MRIIGNTVGTPLPKSNWKQTDPTKGDYIKNKPEVIDPSVGQLLAIKTIDEDGYISEFESVEVSMDEAKEYTDSKIVEFVGDTPVAEQMSEVIDAIPQSDWNQNDETAKDYIKNRPFYETEPVEKTLVEETEIIFSEPGWADIYLETLYLIEGNTYIVKWNETSYECVAINDGDGIIYLGNEQIMIDEGWNFSEITMPEAPFFIYVVGDYERCVVSNATGTVNLNITYFEPEIIKIDPKFLPDMSHPEGSQIGRKGTGVGAEIFNFYDEDSNISTYMVAPEETSNEASGDYSHAEGYSTKAWGEGSHAEGYRAQAESDYSHAEGYNSQAQEEAAHAEGWNTYARGRGSHAEGNQSEARGEYSHAEGLETMAFGEAAHSEGHYTIAYGDYQHVQGRFNIEDRDDDYNPLNTYAHIVGNGEDYSIPSNAHTLDWDGNAWFAGDVYVGSTSGTNKDDGSKKLVTTDDINDLIGDTPVAVQINTAVSEHAEDKNNPHEVKWAQLSDKPFGEEMGVIFNDTITFDENGGCGLKNEIPLTVGNTYKVIWNGTEYECVAQLDADGMGVTLLGDVDYSGAFPFVIMTYPKAMQAEAGIASGVMGGYGATTATLSIEGKVIKTLDPKFLPAHIHELNGYIIPGEEIYPETTIELTEEDGLYGAQFGGAIPFVLGEKYIVNWNGIEYETECKLTSINDGAVIGLGVGNPALNGGEDNGLSFAIGSSSDYDMNLLLSSEELTSTTFSIKKAESIKTIDMRLLPEHLQFGDNTKVILPETTCEVMSDGGDVCIHIKTPALSPLVPGETYTITWNGEKYTKEALDGGSIALLNGTGDEPFGYLMAVTATDPVLEEGNMPEGVYGTSFVRDDSETVTLSIVQENLKTLDPKYLPGHTHTADEIEGLDNIEIAVDSELSDTSENPVQNKVVKEAISNLHTLIGDASVVDQINTALDSYEFITIADIDEICGDMEYNDSLPQSDIDELMTQLQ